MKRWLSYLISMAIFLVFGLGTAAAQTQSRRGTIVVPQSNVELPQNIGKSAHTNFLIFVPAQKGAKPYLGGTSPGGETPSSLACVYQTGLTPLKGCPVIYGSGMNYDNPVGGSNVIAIVDAYDYPTACSDFNTFSTIFNLPTADCKNNNSDPHFRVVYASGSQPRSNCGWAQEEALDIEWAHAMAPDAQIILVEAASNKNNDLLQAVQVASNEVVCGNSSCSAGSSGAGQVSMSWGSSEFSTESMNDSYFSTPGVTYFASSGDSGGKVIWPSASANVISAGGTTVNRASDGSVSEAAWSSAGGGPSSYVPMPEYQSAIQNFAKILNGQRGTPDLSFDADPYTGVSVYDSTFCQGMSGWLVFGGTSVSSPSLAGIFNLAGAFSGGWDGGGNTSSAQDKLYQSFATASSNGTFTPYTKYLYDVISGSAGNYPAGSYWDFASGIGTDRGDSALAGSTSSSPSFSLSVSPTSVSLTQGQSTNPDPKITVKPSNSYNGTVKLSVGGCPSNANCTLSATSVTFTSSTSQSVTLHIATSPTTPSGPYSVIVTGTDSITTSLTSSTAVSLTVTAASSGGVTLSDSNGGAINVPAAGSSGSDTITVTSAGYVGTVNLSVSGLPKFANGSFSPNPVSVSSTTPGSSTLTIKTNRNVATGTPATLTVTATDSSGNSIGSMSISFSVQ